MSLDKKQATGEVALDTARYSCNSILNQSSQIVFMDTRHQGGCPTILSQSENDCTCKITKTTVISQDAWLKRFGQGRKERRAAKASRRAKNEPIL